MDHLEQLKQVMDGFKGSQATLQKHMAEFQTLQYEIEQLRARAHRDPDAQAKLTRLGQIMNGDYQQLRDRLLEKVGQAEAHFKQLEQQFKRFSGSQELESAEPLAEAPALKKYRRPFV